MSKRADSIQIVRALAAVAVVLHHLPRVSNDLIGDCPIGTPEFLSFGYAGVDLFFVVSGFVIAHVTRNQPFSMNSFLERRFWRIVPFYWAFTALFILLASLGEATPLHVKTVVASFAIFPQDGPPVLGVGWSLEHEIIFYLVAAASLRLRLGIVRVLTGLIVMGVLMHVVYPRVTYETLWDFHLFSLFHIQFLLGVLIYRYRGVIAKIEWKSALILGLVGFGMTQQVLSTQLDGAVPSDPDGAGLLGLLRVVAFGLSGSLLIAGLLAAEEQGVLRRLCSPLYRCAIRIGDSSYSLYLSHTIVLGVIGQFARRAHLSAEFLIPALAFSTLACIVTALLWYRHVEQPVLEYFQSRRHAPTPI